MSKIPHKIFFSELHQSIDKKEKVWYFACTMKKGILQSEEYPVTIEKGEISMTKNPPKRTFRKKNKMYIPQTLYCPYCGGKAILRPVSYLFGDEVNPGSSEHYYVCTNYPECDAYIACYHGNFAPKGRLADAWLRHRRNVAHRYIKLIVSSGIMLQKNIYPTIAAKLGVSLENAHVRFSTNYSIEKIIVILREILDNNGIEYESKEIESSPFFEKSNMECNH